jgi:hypothetical protein
MNPARLHALVLAQWLATLSPCHHSLDIMGLLFSLTPNAWDNPVEPEAGSFWLVFEMAQKQPQWKRF